MTKLMNALSENNKIMANAIITQLVKSQPTTRIFEEQIKQFKEKLDLVVTNADFSVVVNEIIVKEKDVFAFLQAVMPTSDPEVVAAVRDYIAQDANLAFILHTLDYNERLSDSIVATKERLSEAAMLLALPEAKQPAAKAFIDCVKGLNPIAMDIQEQKKSFVERLNTAKTMDEIDQIDMDIDARENLLSKAYQAMVTFPIDEETAGAVIQYLENNERVLNIMKTFDFSEALVDNVLAARFKLSSSMRP